MKKLIVEVLDNKYMLKTGYDSKTTLYVKGQILDYNDFDYVEKENIIERYSKFKDLKLTVIEDENDDDAQSKTLQVIEDKEDIVEEKPALESLTAKELKEILDKEGIKYKRNNCKSELRTLINLHQLY